MTGPLVTLGDVPLMKQRIAWTWRPGADPDTLTLSFTREEAARFLQAADGTGFVHLRIQHEMLGFEGGPQKVDVVIPDLYLLTSSGTDDPFTTQLTLADRRVLLAGSRVSGTFNLRRETVDRRELAVEPTGVRANSSGGGLAPAAPQVLSAPGAMTRFIQLGRTNYLEWTINADGTPKTALGICRALLGPVAAGIAGPNKLAAATAQAMLAALAGVTDNQHAEVDVLIREEPLPATLNTWLHKAEVGIAPAPGTVGKKGAIQGGFRAWRTSRGDIADPDMKDLAVLSTVPTTAQGGGFDMENKRLARATKVHVTFPRAQEVLIELNGFERLSGEHVTSLVPRREAYNVLKLPDTLDFKGRRWAKGSWVSVHHAIDMWVNNGDPDRNLARIASNPFSKQIGPLAHNWIGHNWFPSGYLRMLGYRLSGLGLVADAVWGPRMAELERRYLQTWMIDPVLMQYVLELKNQRAAVVDALTGEPLAAYVSSDHAEIYEVGLPEYRLNPRAKAATNVPASKDPSAAVGAPASLEFESESLGVFNVRWDSAYSGRWLKQSVPTLLVEATIPPVLALAELKDAGNPLIKHAWHQAFLHHPAAHKGFVILLMTYGAEPPSAPGAVPFALTKQRPEMYHTVTVEGAAVGFSGRTNDEMRVELTTRQDSARFALRSPIRGKGENDDVPANKETIAGLAAALARQYYFQQHDRLIGRFTVPGFLPGYKLFAHMRSLTVTIEENTAITTTFDFAPPTAPPVAALVDEHVRMRLFGHLPRTRQERGV